MSSRTKIVVAFVTALVAAVATVWPEDVGQLLRNIAQEAGLCG